MNEWNTYDTYDDCTEDNWREDLELEEDYTPDPFTVYKEWKEDNM